MRRFVAILIVLAAGSSIALAQKHAEEARAQAQAELARTEIVLAQEQLQTERERAVADLPAVSVPDASSGVDDRRAVLAALATLPPRQRSCVVLRYYADLSVEETAAVLEITTGTVKSQTSRALASLQSSPLLAGLVDLQGRPSVTEADPS